MSAVCVQKSKIRPRLILFPATLIREKAGPASDFRFPVSAVGVLRRDAGGFGAKARRISKDRTGDTPFNTE